MNIDEDTTQHRGGEAAQDLGTYRIGEQRRRDMSAHTRKLTRTFAARMQEV